MTTPDPKLVQMVVEQVVKAMQQTSFAPAAIQPPIGVCTGDYSQFTDRPDLTTGNSAQAHATPEAVSTPATPPMPEISGIITQAQLQAAIAESPDGMAHLAIDAKLTPLAADYVRENPHAVVRASVSANSVGSAAIGGSISKAGPSTQAYLAWASGHCPGVQQLMADRRDMLRHSSAPRSDQGLITVIQDIAKGVSSGDLTGGVLFVEDPAAALLYANRVPVLRAVQAHRPDRFAQAVKALAPNVIVMQYPRLTGEAMTQLFEIVVQQVGSASPVLLRTLTQLSETH